MGIVEDATTTTTVPPGGIERGAPYRPPRLVTLGASAWQLLGVILVGAITYTFLATLSGVVVPLTIAAVIGIIASPLVDLLHRYRVPRMVGAVIVMVGLIGILVVAVVMAVEGLVDQADEVTEQLTAGVEAIDRWLEDQNIDIGTPASIVNEAGHQGLDWMGGLASYASTIFSSVLAFAMGGFFALFFTYYVLADWHRVRDWVGGHLGVPGDLGAGIVDDVTTLVRRGFYALSLSSLVTAVLIGGTMRVLGLPLAFTVAFVTFVTSYIPYVGAIASGAFGFLVALGAGTLQDALILLAVILVVQNVVQTIVGNRLTSSSLKLHPIASLIATIVGAALAGLLGAMLSAPALATIIAVHRRLAAYQAAPDPTVAAATLEVAAGGADGAGGAG